MLRGLVKLIRHMDGLNAPATMQEMSELLSAAHVTRQDMLNACHFSDRVYARTLLAKSQWYQLLVICWRSGQASPIHDHEGSNCVVRIVDGVATETMFREVQPGIVEATAQRELHANELSTANDKQIHLIENQQPSRELVTLHLYSPALQMNYFDRVGDASG